jgi:hypothetical protein
MRAEAARNAPLLMLNVMILVMILVLRGLGGWQLGITLIGEPISTRGNAKGPAVGRPFVRG